MITGLVGVVCLKAEHEGRAGDIKAGFIWSVFRTEVDTQQRQTGPDGSRQADEKNRQRSKLTNKQNRKRWLKLNDVKLHWTIWQSDPIWGQVYIQRAWLQGLRNRCAGRWWSGDWLGGNRTKTGRDLSRPFILGLFLHLHLHLGILADASVQRDLQ